MGCYVRPGDLGVEKTQGTACHADRLLAIAATYAKCIITMQLAIVYLTYRDKMA